MKMKVVFHPRNHGPSSLWSRKRRWFSGTKNTVSCKNRPIQQAASSSSTNGRQTSMGNKQQVHDTILQLASRLTQGDEVPAVLETAVSASRNPRLSFGHWVGYSTMGLNDRQWRIMCMEVMHLVFRHTEADLQWHSQGPHPPQPPPQPYPQRQNPGPSPAGLPMSAPTTTAVTATPTWTSAPFRGTNIIGFSDILPPTSNEYQQPN